MNKTVTQITSITLLELHKMFISPASYIVSALFLLVWLFFFFQGAFILGEASLRGLFELIPWLLIIFIPALTMGSISKEKREHTLEILLTHPITELQLVLGKFLAVLSFFLAQLGLTLILAGIFSSYGAFDWGSYLAQVIGALLLASTFTALGIWISSLFKDHIASILTSIVTMFLLVIIASPVVTDRVPGTMGNWFAHISVATHYFSIIRGVLDTRDVWYFITTTVVFLSLSILWLYKEKFGSHKKQYYVWQTATVLLIIVTLASNILGARIPGRLDLTKGGRYTLEPVTTSLISQLPETATITLYASDTIPVQLQPVLRDTKDILADYVTHGQGKIAMQIKNPIGNTEDATQARELGIQEVQFNVVSSEEVQLKTGFLGLNIAYQDKNEVLPYIESSEMLEYFLTSSLANMSATDKKTVGFVTGHGEKSRLSDLQALATELSHQFTVIDVDLSVNERGLIVNPGISADILIINEPTTAYEDVVIDLLSQFIATGGSTLVMAEGMLADQQLLLASTTSATINNLITPLGASIDATLVYDLRSHEMVQLANGPMRYFQPYPYWIRAQAVTERPSPIAKETGVTLPWASSITILPSATHSAEYHIQPIIQTTEFAGIQTGSFTINPTTQITPGELKPRVVAVALIPTEASSYGKVAVIGDSDFATDAGMQMAAGNLSMLLELVSWLGDETSLSQIKAKQALERTLLFSSPGEIQAIVYSMYALAGAIPIVVGTAFLLHRKRKQQETFRVGDW